MAENNTTGENTDETVEAGEVLGLQEMESEQDDVQAHLSTLSGSIIGSCGAVH